MVQTRAAELVESLWLRLLSRVGMAVFSVIGTIGLPLLLSWVGGLTADLGSIKDGIHDLRTEFRVAQARDDQRISDMMRRIEALERRDEDRRRP